MGTNLLKAFPDLMLVKDETGDFKKFITVLEEALDLLYADVTKFSDIWDVTNCQERFLPYLAHKIGWNLDVSKSIQIQRKTVGLISRVYKKKGTKQGVIEAIRLLLGYPCTVIELWAGDGWRLGRKGQTELGKSTILSGGVGGPYPYHFKVILPKHLTHEERDAVFTIIDWMKPAWTHYTLKTNGWQLGIDHLGRTTTLQ